MNDLHGASVLVTGGAGFIGSHLVDELLTSRDVREVRVLDNLSNGRVENLARWDGDPRMSLQLEDVRDTRAVLEATDGVDIVFHLACLGVRHSLHAPEENHEVNATATLTLLEQARKVGVPRFIHVSSSEVYGTARYAPMDENHPTYPETVYGASKLAGEAYARAAYRTHGYGTTVVRPFNTYGPRSHFEGDSGEIIPRTIVRALCGLGAIVFGDGDQTRDFTHVTDTARGLADLAGTAAAIGQTVNVGSGVETSINSLVATIARAAGRPGLQATLSDARPGDVRRLIVDAGLMQKMTGFTPRVQFEAGVADLVKWFDSQPISPAEMLSLIEQRNWVALSEAEVS